MRLTLTWRCYGSVRNDFEDVALRKSPAKTKEKGEIDLGFVAGESFKESEREGSGD